MNDVLASEILRRIQYPLEQAVNALKPFESGSVEARVKHGKELVTEADLAMNRVCFGV